MRRLWLALGFAGLVGAALLLGAIWTRPVEGGDATTDRADDVVDDAPGPLRVTPVPLEDPHDRRAPRWSTDPDLDTGDPARADGGWL